MARVLIHSTAKIKRGTTNVDGEVVSKGEDIETMLREVLQKHPDEIPFVAMVPDKMMII